MSYDNWRVDGSPENSLIYRKQYSVHADISKCFPSVYTHSLAWALAGKNVAKANKNNRLSIKSFRKYSTKRINV